MFFSQVDRSGLWGTALTLENLGSRAAVPASVGAPEDENLDRRHAAVCAEAAESLADLDTRLRFRRFSRR
jgi:hypothetical protein